MLKAMRLVVKSNVKTSATNYIHATTHIQVKPIFMQALMIWFDSLKVWILSGSALQGMPNENIATPFTFLYDALRTISKNRIF